MKTKQSVQITESIVAEMFIWTAKKKENFRKNFQKLALLWLNSMRQRYRYEEKFRCSEEYSKIHHLVSNQVRLVSTQLIFQATLAETTVSYKSSPSNIQVINLADMNS